MAQDPANANDDGDVFDISKKIQAKQMLTDIHHLQSEGCNPYLFVVGFSKLKQLNEVGHQWGDAAMDMITIILKRFVESKNEKTSGHTFYRLGASSAGKLIPMTDTNTNIKTEIKSMSKVVQSIITQLVKERSKDIGTFAQSKPQVCSLIDESCYRYNFYNYEQSIDKYYEKSNVNECNCNCLHNWDTNKRYFHDILFAGTEHSISKKTDKDYQCISLDIDHLSKVISKYNDSCQGRKAANNAIISVGNSLKDYFDLIEDEESGIKFECYHNSGDEFCVVGVGVDIDTFIEVGWEIIQHVKKESNMSVTVGVSYNMLVADKALDVSKKNGYRGVVVTCFGTLGQGNISQVGPKKDAKTKKYIQKQIAKMR